MDADLQGWIGRSETFTDVADAARFARLCTMLDRAPEKEHVPPLGHWLMFLNKARQDELGPDGHPMRGGLVPPIALPMRMAAGSRISFRAPIPLDAQVKRVTTITKLAEKQGRTGPLVFLTTRHDVLTGDTLCVSEEMDVVFRDRSGSGPVAEGERRTAQVSRTIDPTSALLFRYSALTYNSHLIHYDRDYAMKKEGYPGLVVHGPLQATLLADHFRRHRPGKTIQSFTFQARRPVYDLKPFTVNLTDTPDGAEVWTADGDGFVAMSGRIVA